MLDHAADRGGPAVARAAGVDAALVHHYFDGKADLFIAAGGVYTALWTAFIGDTALAA